ncbi:ornithine carbamoyltransferase [Natrinema soli]|uniref:Ornithine carbamoyltransferase n=1 Tax=Natrinema soli TaxID=1930624 RepID=A0ABD5SH12_9EURY|nr:ornithine carbamoyltransferase [Natrinema soli]
MNQPSHLLTVADLDLETVGSLCATATLLDQDHTGRAANVHLSRRVVALLFERPSTRTRLGFESGMASLGGHAVSMSADEFQFGRGTEDVTDAARAVSQFVDGIIVRTGDHETLEQFSSAAEVPVVNALSDRAHPCEALADLYFLQSRFETLDELSVTWIGDCTNVARSFAAVCVLAGIDVRIACPPEHRFNDETTAQIESLGSGSLRFFNDPISAVEGTAVVYTDVWTSMGQEDEREERLEAFSTYQVNSDLLSSAPEAIVMHCLPANRGEEITTSVLDSDRSVVWQQARTRLPMQQAILEYVCT